MMGGEINNDQGVYNGNFPNNVSWKNRDIDTVNDIVASSKIIIDSGTYNDCKIRISVFDKDRHSLGDIFGSISSEENPYSKISTSKEYILNKYPTAKSISLLCRMQGAGHTEETMIRDVSFDDDTYEPYVDPQILHPSADGIVTGMTSLSPNMTILTATPGVTIDATYNRDSNAVIGGLLDRITALEDAATQQI